MNRPASCDHRPACPGCPLLGAPFERVPALQTLATFAAEQRVELGLMPAPTPLAYRHRARLAVRGRAQSPAIGIFATGTHHAIDIPRCLVHHAAINHAVDRVRSAIADSGLPPYAERSHRGLVRYLQAVVDSSGQQLQLTVVGNCESSAPLRPLFERLCDSLRTQLQGLFWNGQTSRGNAIFGERFERIAGADALTDTIAGARVFIPPDAFFQNNPSVYARMIAWIGGFVPEGVRLLELYAGVGAIGLSLLPTLAEVTFNELASGSLRGLSCGIDALSPGLSARVRVMPGRAGDCGAAVQAADVVIADPPRKGLDPELLGVLGSAGPRRFIYVSCDVRSLLRDARILCAGPWALTALRACELFPWTGHVESIAVFDRR